MRNRKSVLQREKLPSTKSSKEAKSASFLPVQTKPEEDQKQVTNARRTRGQEREREVLLLTHLLVCIRDLHHLLEGLGYGRR
jgi:hypothetical protein